MNFYGSSLAGHSPHLYLPLRNTIRSVSRTAFEMLLSDGSRF
jgi:hypothetical protein